MSKAILVPSISYEQCKHLSDRAIEEAAKIGISISVSVVDPGGNQKYFVRSDSAPLISIDASLKKAKTAVSFGVPTGQAWLDFAGDDPILQRGIHDLKDFMLLGGGSPILCENVMIGAIGVSGGHYSQDEECVKSALLYFNE